MTKKGCHERRFNFRKFKILLLCLIITGLFLTVIVRLYVIQIGKRDFYLSKLHGQYGRVFNNSASFRGEIYDRNGVELATSILSFSVYVYKNKINDINHFASNMSEVLGIKKEEIISTINQTQAKGLFIAKKIEDLTIKNKLLSLKKQDRKGVSDAFEVVEESKRYYPYKELASHVIGFVNDDNEGLEGIEYFYDKKIKGVATKVSYGTDIPEGFFIKGKPVKEGNSIELSIDKDVQSVAEEELKKGILKTKAKSGFVIVMDPHSGEILAMSSYPQYDPNNYSAYSPWERRNRAVIDLFEPGSVMKVFVISAGIEERLINPQTKVYCENGIYRVHDRKFKEAHHKRYGTLSIEEVLKYSSNIGSIKVGELLGKKKLYEYLTDFGFGAKTDVGFPGEVRGIVPKPKELTPVRLSTVSFGQGISVTPLQLIRGFSAVINGGYLVKPILIKRILDEDNNTIWTNQKEIIKRVVSENTSKILREMLRKAVIEGTGKEAEVEGLEVIGKTGTAQKPGKRGYLDEYYASFIGAFPKDNPKYAIFVGVDAPKGIAYGGYVAAPIFREIAKKIIELQGGEKRIVVMENVVYNKNVEKEHPDSKSKIEVSALNYKADENKSIPDFKGLALREAIRVANLKKIDIEIHGSGIVYAQDPLPDSTLFNEKKVVLYLK
ncbi:MAG: transpeptidase family protein [Proteobacteria bacterium]|nr:transpeptidase family protein [Pseudomonadota bacterium]